MDEWGLERAVRVAVGEPDVTPFTAPEVIEDPEAGSEETDVYGLGALAYFGLTGQPPIADGADLARAITEGDITPPSEANGSLSPAVDTIVMQALATNPADRPDSAYLFKQAFEQAYTPAEQENSKGSAAATAGGATAGTTASNSEEADEQVEADDESLVSRRAALGILGVGVLGAYGSWELWNLWNQMGRRSMPATGDTNSTSRPTPTPTPTPTRPPNQSQLPEPTQQWTFSAGDEVNTSPAVVDGTVYIGSDDNNVYALNAEDGTQNWVFETGDFVQSSPVIASDVVYVGSWWDDGHLYAIDAADGTERWSFNTNGNVSSAPAVVDGTVYVENTSTLFAISAADGTVEWRYETSEEVDSPPTVADGMVYFGSFIEAGRGRVYALSATDGFEQWTFETNGAVYSAPAVDTDTVYVGSQQNIYALNRADGTEQWTFQNGVYSSPAVVDDTIYVGGSNVYALSSDDGDVRWEFPTRGNVRPSPAVTEETVYVGTAEGKFYALNKSDGSGEWSLDIDGAFLSSPAVVNGTVYVGDTNGTIYALEAVDGGSNVANRWPMFGYGSANIGYPPMPTMPPGTTTPTETATPTEPSDIPSVLEQSLPNPESFIGDGTRSTYPRSVGVVRINTSTGEFYLEGPGSREITAIGGFLSADNLEPADSWGRRVDNETKLIGTNATFRGDRLYFDQGSFRGIALRAVAGIDLVIDGQSLAERVELVRYVPGSGVFEKSNI